MRLFVTFAALTGAALALSAYAQDGPRPGTTQERAPAVFIEKIKKEAAQIESAKLSLLFTAAAGPEIHKELGLDQKQIDLVRRLEKLTREITRDWLLRGLDADPPPLPAILAERLSERGDRLRARLVEHAEAMVLEGILSQEQAQSWRRATGRKPERLLAGRFGPPGLAETDPNPSVSQLAGCLQSAGSSCKRAGEILMILLGWPGMREAFPNGIGHLDPLGQKMARSRMPKIELPKRQADLVAKLDGLTMAIWRAWLTRGLDRDPLPPQHVLAQRLASREPLRESLGAHTEAIVLEGIVTADQAERCLILFWRASGVRALLDPALVSRLRLSRAQCEEVLLLIKTKEHVAAEDEIVSRPPRSIDADRPELQEWTAGWDRVAHRHQDEIDALIWEVLIPSQARAFRRILNDPQ